MYNKSSSLYYLKQEEEAKVEAIVVNKFLENHTGIYSAKIFNNSNLRANMVFDEETQKSWPALTIFVKNDKDEITGAKILALNSKTCNKADVAEKSVGTISGSFAEIAQQNSKYSPVTIITKDIETALTIQQARVEGKILCAIEAENLQNYNPGPKEKIILAVKNDVNTEKAEKVLEDKEAVVCTVKNDFNNVLKTQGLYAVRNIISPENRICGSSSLSILVLPVPVVPVIRICSLSLFFTNSKSPKQIFEAFLALFSILARFLLRTKSAPLILALIIVFLP
ncbi:putative conjugative transfer protein TraI [Orientia tsutsugamushi str. Ikeda]|uniref:Putative conjugative transfer protein TraI n=1 Tax=Orientia tsutsugamushi (strain Ikeda) TaxID=334380 RepID=B3CTN9_ORITI|nr:putative conjugative transfer protein TraI [Orientia tsutsugamushi str. Ikeda]